MNSDTRTFNSLLNISLEIIIQHISKLSRAIVDASRERIEALGLLLKSHERIDQVEMEDRACDSVRRDCLFCWGIDGTDIIA